MKQNIFDISNKLLSNYFKGKDFQVARYYEPNILDFFLTPCSTFGCIDILGDGASLGIDYHSENEDICVQIEATLFNNFYLISYNKDTDVFQKAIELLNDYFVGKKIYGKIYQNNIVPCEIGLGNWYEIAFVGLGKIDDECVLILHTKTIDSNNNTFKAYCYQSNEFYIE